MVTPRRFVIVDDTTIREKRDHEEERRPRKRKRDESEEGEDGPMPPIPKFKPKKSHVFFNVRNSDSLDDKVAVEHDPVYFEEGPDRIVVRIENVLFKFRRELLDCSKPMQSCLEQHEKEFGAASESNPFFLQSTVQEFRAFLWALHAPVGDLRSLPSSDAQLSRLFNIVSASSTFHSPNMADWVSDTIRNAAKSTSLMDACSSATLSQFMDIAVEYEYHDVLKLVVDKWCSRLIGKSTPSVPAMQAADRHGESTMDELKMLRGIAYYVHVQDMLDRQPGRHDYTGATHLRTDPKLNNGQVIRLLAGYWSLVNLWEWLRLNPTPLPRASACSAQTHEKCASIWSRRWFLAVGCKRILGHSSADIMALLDTLKDVLSNDEELKVGLHSDCRTGGLNEIKKYKEKTMETLSDHFAGCV